MRYPLFKLYLSFYRWKVQSTPLQIQCFEIIYFELLYCWASSESSARVHQELLHTSFWFLYASPYNDCAFGQYPLNANFQSLKSIVSNKPNYLMNGLKLSVWKDNAPNGMALDMPTVKICTYILPLNSILQWFFPQCIFCSRPLHSTIIQPTLELIQRIAAKIF